MLKIYDNGSWVEHNNVLPYTVALRLDESLDTAEVQVIRSTSVVYEPLKMVQLFDGTSSSDWIIENNSCERIGINRYLHTFELIEATELLKGVPLDNMTFTQPIDPDSDHPEINLQDVLKRLLETASSNLGQSLVNKFSINSGVGIRFSKIKSPEFFFSGYTLYDALFEIGTFLDSVPRVTYDFFEYTNKLSITFDALELDSKTDYRVDQAYKVEKQHPLNNYANKVISKVSNLSLEGLVRYPAGDNIGVFVDGGESYEITDNNAVITLPHNVKYVKKFEVKLSTEDYYREEFEYKEFGRWRLLNPASFAGMKPYYKYNDNKIYNLKAYIESFPGGGDTPRPVLRESLFRVTYVPIIDAKIVKENEASEDYSVVYNQKGNVINADSYAENVNNYIKRMEKGDIVVSKSYKNQENIPKVGHSVNGKYTITNVMYIKKRTYYDVTLQLSEDYTRRAEFIRANQEIRSWEIPADGKVVTRDINRKETIKFSLIYDENEIIDSSVIYADSVMNVLFKHSSPNGSVVSLDFKTKDGTVYPGMLIPSIGSASNDLILKFNAIDNTLLGYSKAEKWTGTISNQIGVTYTDKFGTFESVRVGFCNYLTGVITEEDLSINYPLSNVDQNNTLYGRSYIAIDFDSLNVKKDAREVFNFTYQLSYEGKTSTIVNYKNLTSRVLGQDIKDYNIKVLFLNRKVKRIDTIESTDIIESIISPIISTSENTISYTIADTAPIPSEFTSVAIAYDYVDGSSLNNVMVAQNVIDVFKQSEIKSTGVIDLHVYF